jgi:cytoskeletal protein CcmA (bactofilin family)
MFSRSGKASPRQEMLSIIGGNCTLNGDIASQGELHIDGRVDGDVRCDTLLIGEGGNIIGEINADKVRVLGAVTGTITARAVELARTARVIGDITHDSLTVEAGAFVEGRFNRLSAEEPTAEAVALPLLTAANSAPTKDEAKAPAAGQVLALGG